MSTQDGPGFIYILTNEAMPGLCKIGLTKDPIKRRLNELSNPSGVPAPFHCFFLAKVDDMKRTESGLHRGLTKFRYNPRREFFTIEPAEAQALLELMGEDVTPREDLTEDQENETVVVRRSGSKLDFGKLDIAIGSMLTFVKDQAVTATVSGSDRVNFNGQELSLSQAALQALRDAGYQWKSVRGPAFWTYENESIAARIDRLSEGE